MEQLKTLIQIQPEAEEFLGKHAFLVPLIEEAVPHVRTHFPTDSLMLEKVDDYDSCANCDPGQVCLYIQTEEHPAQAFRLLNHVDADWWLGASDRAKGLFFLNIRF